MKKRPQQQRPCSGKRLTWMWEEGRKERKTEKKMLEWTNEWSGKING